MQANQTEQSEKLKNSLAKMHACQDSRSLNGCNSCELNGNCAIIKDVLGGIEFELKSRTDEVKSCQEALNLQTCTNCAELIECERRGAYVKSVYLSMNKGERGGFDF